MKIRIIFGSNVRKYRKNNRLSQMDLSKKCKISRSYISEVELGKRNVTMDNIESIAKALKISVDKLFVVEKEQ